MRAYTKVPEKLRNLIRQRLRWMRGGVDVLLEHGVNRYTGRDVLGHMLFVALLLGVIFAVGIGITQGGWKMGFSISPLPILLAGVGYAISLYKIRYLERIEVADVLIRIAIIPELVMAILMSFVQLWAYFLAFTHKKQNW